MTYIQTSKTRKRWPNGKTVAMERLDNEGEIRICDERYADKNGGRHGFSDPRDVPRYSGTDRDGARGEGCVIHTEGDT